MAIQVNGTTVIDNSRNISNVGTVSATSFSGSGANLTNLPQGAPFAPANFDPSTTPDATFTSSGTWTKPASIAAGTWITIYAVGGGGARMQPDGNWGNSGGGAAAVCVGIVPDTVSSIAFTIGAGATGGTRIDGGDTTFTIYGVTYTATGGHSGGQNNANYQEDYVITPNGYYSVPPDGKSAGFSTAACASGSGSYSGQLPSGQTGAYYNVTCVLGAGGGGGGFSAPNPNPGVVSTYAGNGGAGQPSTGSATNGSAPGGGGGGSASSISIATAPGNGGNGSVRIWYG